MNETEWEALCGGLWKMPSYRKFIEGRGKKQRLTRIACNLLDLETGNVVITLNDLN